VSHAPLFIDSAGETFGRILATRNVDGFVIRESRYRPGLHMPLHSHPHAYLSYVVAGELDECDSRGDRRYGPGSLHYHPAEERHSADTGNRDMVCMSIVPVDSVEAAVRSGGDPPRRGPLTMELARLAARCHREFQAKDSASDLALEGAALELVATLMRMRTPEEGAIPRWLAEARDYLDAHYREQVRLRSLSRLTGVHEVHLVRCFRRQWGVTPGTYVRRLRIERACEALTRPEASIVDIALEAGYSSQAHFTRVFRRLVGMTPGEYRRARSGGS
jgi:AraC-like DNA-binding protein/quercetin dioxygenase-like cupin family protein